MSCDVAQVVPAWGFGDGSAAPTEPRWARPQDPPDREDAEGLGPGSFGRTWPCLAAEATSEGAGEGALGCAGGSGALGGASVGERRALAGWIPSVGGGDFSPASPRGACSGIHVRRGRASKSTTTFVVVLGSMPVRQPQSQSAGQRVPVTVRSFTEAPRVVACSAVAARGRGCSQASFAPRGRGDEPGGSPDYVWFNQSRPWKSSASQSSE